VLHRRSRHDTRPAGERVRDPSIEQLCFVQAADGRRVAFTRGSGSFILTVDSPTYFEVTEAEDGKIFLRSAHGEYISAGEDGAVRPAPSPSGWEAFAVERPGDGTFRLRSFHGSYLAANLEQGTLELGESPGRARGVALVAAFDPERYRRAVQRTRATGPTEKTVWTFWDRGAERMSPFYQLNVDGWRHLLGPSWRIEVVNAVDGDLRHVRRFVDPSDLPPTFERLSPVVQSDAVRLALLKTHGGVWMDASNILLRPIEEICWRQMSAPDNPDGEMVLSGFCNTGWGSDHLQRKDCFESWFIAARRDNQLVDLWHRVFIDYWSDRTASTASWAHPLFERMDLSNFNRYGLDFRNYLVIHIAFRRVIEHDPHMRWLWRHNMILHDAGDEAFYLTQVAGWDARDIYRTLIETKDAALADRLSATCLMKFTSSMVGRIADLSRAELLSDRHTLGAIYARVFGSKIVGAANPAT
jgi:hypothetical protein